MSAIGYERLTARPGHNVLLLDDTGGHLTALQVAAIA